MPQITVHGGDIYNHEIQYDFSVNINPVEIGESVRSKMMEAASNYGVYPEDDNVRLRDALGKKMGVGRNQVLCGNGASELLAAVMHAYRPQKVLIPQPAFEGYGWSAQMVDAQMVDYRLREEDGFALTEDVLEFLSEDLGMLVLTNPSNPAGRLIPPGLLLQILEQCQQMNIMVLVDECFIEFTDQESACSLLPDFENLIIVRAFTKIYGMPGVRLGYLLAAEDCCKKIARQLPEWNLSVLAQGAGLALMDQDLPGWDQKAYIDKTKTVIKEERRFLKEELINLINTEIKVYPSETNFLLFYCKSPLYELLLTRGILIRDCSNYPGLGQGYYRIAVRSREENQALLRAVADIYGR